MGNPEGRAALNAASGGRDSHRERLQLCLDDFYPSEAGDPSIVGFDRLITRELLWVGMI
jgi:hypothetical protein